MGSEVDQLNNGHTIEIEEMLSENPDPTTDLDEINEHPLGLRIPTTVSREPSIYQETSNEFDLSEMTEMMDNKLRHSQECPIVVQDVTSDDRPKEDETKNDVNDNKKEEEELEDEVRENLIE